jgi:hypothetical protein
MFRRNVLGKPFVDLHRAGFESEAVAGTAKKAPTPSWSASLIPFMLHSVPGLLLGTLPPLLLSPAGPLADALVLLPAGPLSLPLASLTILPFSVQFSLSPAHQPPPAVPRHVQMCASVVSLVTKLELDKGGLRASGAGDDEQHTGSTKAAHETILDALCSQAGIATERRNIPTFKKRNMWKNGQGDLVLKRVGLGGQPDLILDVALNHEFGGNHMADVGRNGELHNADPSKILKATTRTPGAPVPGGLCGAAGCRLRLPALCDEGPRRVFAAALHPRPPPDCPLVRAVRGSFQRRGFKFRRGQYFWHTRCHRPRRVRLPNVCTWPSTPCVALAPAPTPRTTSCIHLLLPWVSKWLRTARVL